MPLSDKCCNIKLVTIYILGMCSLHSCADKAYLIPCLDLRSKVCRLIKPALYIPVAETLGMLMKEEFMAKLVAKESGGHGEIMQPQQHLSNQ